MPKIYTLQQKQHALFVIQQLNNYKAASQVLDIPVRTLQDWWNQYNNRRWDPDFRPQRTALADYHTTAQDSPVPNLTKLRDNLLKQIDNITTTPTDDPRKAYYAALAVRALLEQVRALNRAIGVQPPTDPA